MRSRTARATIILLPFVLTAAAVIAKGEQKSEREREFDRLTDTQGYEPDASRDAVMARLEIELKLKRGCGNYSFEWAAL